jgi:dGTPase
VQDRGGFEHNRQSLRIVEELEQKYPGFPGLNLTWETRESLVKHYTSYDHPSKRDGFEAKSSSLEAQVANLADEVAYQSHDLDDGLEAGLLAEADLEHAVRLWHDAAATIRRELGELPDECRRYFIIRCLIDGQVRDVVHTTELRIRETGIRSADEARLLPDALVQYSPLRRELNLELRDYLYANLYYNPIVHEPNLRAVRQLEHLFHFYLEHPGEVGEQSRKRADKFGWPRVVCDYLAGMTDRYVLLEYQRLLCTNVASA